MEDDLNLFEKGRRPNFFEKSKTTSKKKCNQKQLKVKTMVVAPLRVTLFFLYFAYDFFLLNDCINHYP